MSDLQQRVEKGLEEIRPTLQADGGDIELVEIKNDEVFVNLKGACHGCPSASVTMTQGVEKVVKRHAPEIKAVKLADAQDDHDGHDHHGHDHHGHDHHGHTHEPPPEKSHNPFEDQEPISGVKTILAVASGKGGVGKTTVAINLAMALQKQGLSVGILDADIYGPNVPGMLGVKRGPDVKGKRVVPAYHHDLAVMSIAFFVGAEEAVIWRGPMVMKAVQQFLRDVEWGELDVLVVDLPPGTGDAQLTLAQEVPITGAVIVTTPSAVALEDVRRGLQMFEAVQIPVFGVVENMSYYVCPHCNRESDPFDQGGGKLMAEKYNLPLLAELPLDPEIRAAGDEGQPMIATDPEAPQSKKFMALAEQVYAKLQKEIEPS